MYLLTIVQGLSPAAVPASGSTFSVGMTTVTVTATDASSEHCTCTFNVTVNDTEDPVIIGCQGGTYPNTPGQCGAQVAFAEARTDNCDTDLSLFF
ncbi:MAG: HYR domain-containing protein [Saprospiraceae bacterium]